MIFVEHLTIPANTPSDSPVDATLDIIRGRITLVSVQFPPGVNALAHLVVRWGAYQLFPSNQSGDFSTGGETIPWDESLDVDAEPLKLTLIGWNEDTTYDHTITLRVVMQPATNQAGASQAISELLQQQTSQAGES